MLVLVMGHRLPLAKCLERLEIPYIVWTEKPVINKLRALQILVKEFPVNRDEVCAAIPKSVEITHVIASVEKSVIPASNIRLWFKLKRNPHNLILKCTDKYKMKSYLSEKNIPMTEFCSVNKYSDDEVIAKFGFPIVSKPRLSSGGRGILFINSKEELRNNKTSQFYYEKAIVGREGSIESFIHNKEIIFSNITEYFKPGYCNKIPARYEQDLADKIKKLNSDVVKALNIKWGMTHLEYYITDTGLYFGEVALRPPGGYIMDVLSMVSNFDAWEQFVRVELDLLENTELKQDTFGASILIHPKVGTVEQVEGELEVRNLTSLKKLKLSLKTNEVIKERKGVSQNYGYAFLHHTSSMQLDKDIDEFYSKFKIHIFDERK